MHGFLTIDNAMVIAESKVHHGTNNNLTVFCDRARRDGMHPRMADCGGLMIGVDIIEPKVPPLVIENVPPCNASSGNLPLRACVAYSAICRSISTKESGLRIA